MSKIEQKLAEDWQSKLKTLVQDLDIVLFNPRRDDWDSSWIQSIDNPQFNEQVTWELDSIESSDIVIFYFDPNTKSPITLMELGYAIGQDNNVVVCCPEGFWRKGNVDIICSRNSIKMVDSIEGIADFIKDCISVEDVKL